jgi:hypothetical protein
MRAQIAAMKEIWTKDKPEQERRLRHRLGQGA